jgi:spore germination protein
MLSALSPTGTYTPEIIDEIINNEEYQDYLINNLLDMMEKTGYHGINMILHNVNEDNQDVYIKFLSNLNNRISVLGYLLFITLNPNIEYDDNRITYLNLDYKTFSQICYRLTFLQYIFGINPKPPSPVSNITLLRTFLNNIVSISQTENISIGNH